MDFLKIDLHPEKAPDFVAYGQISIAFTVNSVFDIVPQAGGLNGLSLVERHLQSPYVKDYDLDGERADDWPHKFDTSHWITFCAYQANQLLGGATEAWKTPELNLVPYRQDQAILWDVRVTPELRSQGVGRHLMDAVKDWASTEACTELIVETQNINVPASRFYASQGFELFSIRPFAYADHPEEVQLLWRLMLN